MSSLSVKLPAPNMKSTNEEEDDDWETDPDFLNAVNEKESRWGAKTVDGSGHQESIRLDKLREEVLKSDQIGKERKLAQMPRASEGYGGKFGVQHDRVDQCAVGFEYQGKVETHASQRDYSLGFGGTFGVQTDRVDKSAVGWDSHETVEKHESQKDYKMGFGGQFGVQSDRKDKTAAGWDEKEQTSKHESQTDYKKGFGGQFGVQTDRKDKSALGWNEVEKVKPHESQTDYKKGFGGQFGIQSDHQDKSALGWDEREKLQSHESQTDYKKGFGGQFGVQSDRKDKTAHGWEEHEKVEKHESQTDYKKGFGGQFGVQSDRQDKSALEQTEGEEGTKTSAQTHKIGAQNQQKSAEGATKSLRSKFEKMATQGEQQNLDRVREERERRKREDEQLRQRQADEERRRQQRLEEQWAKQSDDGVEKGEEQQQQQRVAQPPKQRPTIGVRLPFLLPEQQRDSRLADENSAENESHSVADSAVEEPQPPPVKVLPTGADFALPQHKIATSAAPNFEEKKSLNLVTKEEEEENPIVRDSGEWADEPTNSTPPQKGEDQNKQQQCHQYELPPIADDGVPNVPTSAASALSALPQHIYSESDQNMPPPADPSPAVVAEPSVGECAAATPLGTSTGATAVALFEYERQDDDEIGFEVNDIITDIEQIDVGWWRGVCKGRYGLFPANYVQLTEQK